MNYADMPLITWLVKEEIRTQFGSIRKFSIASGIPSTTLSSAFQKNLMSTSINLLLEICANLNIDINELIRGRIVKLDTDCESDKSLINDNPISAFDPTNADIIAFENGNPEPRQLSQDEAQSFYQQLLDMPPEAFGDMKVIIEFLQWKYKNKK